MNRRVLPLFLLLLGWFALGFWLCKKYLCNSVPTDTISQSSLAPVESADWTFGDGNEFSTNSPDYFGFAKSGSTHMSMGAGLEASIASAAAYLKSHPDRSMDITGYYMDSETNNSIMPTLGMARANDIKNIFVSKGVATNQLNLMDALLPESSWADANNVNRGIELAFTAKATKATTDTRLEDIKARLFGKPLTIYFGTNKDEISLTSQQRTAMSDMVYYLDRVSDAKLEIGGHTDNSGGRRYNQKLSKERASAVLDYLAGKGLTADRMNSQGFGPDKPISSNETEDGMAKNRRVEIVLK